MYVQPGAPVGSCALQAVPSGACTIQFGPSLTWRKCISRTWPCHAGLTATCGGAPALLCPPCAHQLGVHTAELPIISCSCPAPVYNGCLSSGLLRPHGCGPCMLHLQNGPAAAVAGLAAAALLINPAAALADVSVHGERKRANRGPHPTCKQGGSHGVTHGTSSADQARTMDLACMGLELWGSALEDLALAI
jgi:hypothetical protein